jgi:hypothetical protein
LNVFTFSICIPVNKADGIRILADFQSEFRLSEKQQSYFLSGQFSAKQVQRKVAKIKNLDQSNCSISSVEDDLKKIVQNIQLPRL